MKKQPQNRCANGLSQGLDNVLLRTLFWNAGGLTNDKFSEFKQLIVTRDIDLFGIVEAGASTETPQYFQIPGYQTYVLRRGRQVASGIIVAAKKSLVVKYHIRKEMNNEDKHEAIELEVWKNSVHRRFIIAYNPPQNKPDLDWLEAVWDRKCILFGDLNAPSTRWGYQETSVVGRLIEEFLDSNPVLFIENDLQKPTFFSYAGQSSHPDVVLCHTALFNQIKHTILLPPGGFGHSILAVNIIKASCFKNQPFRMRWNLKKANWELFTDLAEQYLKEDLVTEQVDASLQRISSTLIACAKKAIPRGRLKRYSPFWNEELQNLKDERDEARKTAECTKILADRLMLKEKTAKFKKEIIQSKRTRYKEFLQSLDFRKDGARAHRLISRLNNEDGLARNNPIKNGSKMLTSSSEIAKYFCSYYAKVSNFKPSRDITRPNTRPASSCPTEEEVTLFYDDFQVYELEAALSQNQPGKSAGPDEILPEFLSHLGNNAKGTILRFLNLIWSAHYPCEWRKAEIIPILKKGKDASSPENYRPISLTSVFSKLYERMILRRLQQYIENHNLLSSNQAGFARHRCTVEHVTRISQEIKDGFHRKQHTLAVFIDFKTAFDRVWRQKLIDKLICKGVKGNLLNSLNSFLCQRFIRVKFNDTLSPYRQTRQGLPQGSVISPTLFNVMIDDVVSSLETIPGINALLYADDLVVWATSSDVKALEAALNRALGKLHQWTSTNEMTVNPQKTEYQLFTLSTKQYSLTFFVLRRAYFGSNRLGYIFRYFSGLQAAMVQTYRKISRKRSEKNRTA